MSFNVNKAKSSATSTAGVVGGMIVGHVASKVIREKAPANIAKFAPGILAIAAIAAPAFMQVKSDVVSDMLTGVAAAGTVAQLNSFSKDASGEVATTGVKAMIAKYVPQLGSVEELPTYTVYQGEPAESLLLAGGEYEEDAQAISMMGHLGNTDSAVSNLLAA